MDKNQPSILYGEIESKSIYKINRKGYVIKEEDNGTRFDDVIAWLDIPMHLNVSEILSYHCVDLDKIKEVILILDKVFAKNCFHGLLRFKHNEDMVDFLKIKQDKSSTIQQVTAIHFQGCSLNSNTILTSKLNNMNEPTIDLSECAVCLDKILLESHISILTLPCAHTFHAPCMLNWNDTRCPLCRHSYLDYQSKIKSIQQQVTVDGVCPNCSNRVDKYICLICGNKSCFLHAEKHAQQHHHALSLQQNTNLVFDFIKHMYLYNDYHLSQSSKALGDKVDLEEEINSLQLQFKYQKMYYDELLLPKINIKKQLEQDIQIMKQNIILYKQVKENHDSISKELDQLNNVKSQNEVKLQNITNKFNQSKVELDVLKNQVPVLQKQIDQLMKRLD